MRRAALVATLTAVAMGPGLARAQEAGPEPAYLRDRGTGLPTSMFGTYIRPGELIVYPFYEYYRDKDLEYAPADFGYGLEQDFRGEYHAHETLLFLSYGISDRFAVEVEAAVISASLDKSPDDTSLQPGHIEESGLGDVEGQLRWRWQKETARRPELYSWAEFVVPHAKDKPLIGTPGIEASLGVGAVRGFRFGTISARLALAYEEASESHFDLGEYGIEYLKRAGEHLRFYVGLEGTQDELSLITEVQVHLTRHMFIKLNNGLGLTSRATDWSPEVGILFTLPTR
jgi:hypothetical protein